jgi:hypothetical protein
LKNSIIPETAEKSKQKGYWLHAHHRHVPELYFKPRHGHQSEANTAVDIRDIPG